MRSFLRFSSEQRALALDTPSITRERTVAADHAVTRDSHSERIGGAGLRYGASRLRRADAAGDVAVARGLSCGDGPQCLPDALLEGCAPHIQRQIQSQSGRFHASDHPSNPLFELNIATHEGRFRETVLQVSHEGIGVIAHRDGAHPSVTARNENGAQRALPNGEADLGVYTTGAVARRRHAEHVVGLSIEPTPGVVSGAVNCIRYGTGADKLLPHPFGAVRGGVCLRS